MKQEAIWFERTRSSSKSISKNRATLGRIERVVVVSEGLPSSRILLDGIEQDVPTEDIYKIPDRWPEALQLIDWFFHGKKPGGD